MKKISIFVAAMMCWAVCWCGGSVVKEPQRLTRVPIPAGLLANNTKLDAAQQKVMSVILPPGSEWKANEELKRVNKMTGEEFINWRIQNSFYSFYVKNGSRAYFKLIADYLLKTMPVKELVNAEGNVEFMNWRDFTSQRKNGEPIKFYDYYEGFFESEKTIHKTRKVCNSVKIALRAQEYIISISFIKPMGDCEEKVLLHEWKWVDNGDIKGYVSYNKLPDNDKSLMELRKQLVLAAAPLISCGE